MFIEYVGSKARSRVPMKLASSVSGSHGVMALANSLGLVYLVALLSLLGVINCNCYYPNGELSTGDQPCSSDSDSACCPLNWECLSNGLCHLENAGYLGRYTCSDQTWKSANCPNICTHGTLCA